MNLLKKDKDQMSAIEKQINAKMDRDDNEVAEAQQLQKHQFESKKKALDDKYNNDDGDKEEEEEEDVFEGFNLSEDAKPKKNISGLMRHNLQR